MIDESIMEKIIPLPDEDEEMEKVQGELEGEGFPITNFKKGGIFYHLCRMLVTIYIELKELARTIVNGCFIKHAEGDWLKIKAADYSKQQKEAKAARGYVSIYRSEYNNALQVTKGHCFKTEPDAGGNELKFYCCENTVIDAGEPVGRVLVEAEATGTYYNIAPGRITISMIHLDGVDYVTNEDDWLFEEGAEEEDLEDLRDRCMSSWAELATRTIEEKLRNAAKAVPGVLDARIDAQHPRGQGTVDVIVTGAAGEASPELIRKVGEAIEPLKGNYEDYLVKSSEVVRQDFELVIYLAEDAAIGGGGTGTAVVKSSKNADLAAEVFAYIKLSEDANKEVWNVLGFDPVNTSVWTDTDLTQNPDNQFVKYFKTKPFDTLLELQDSIGGLNSYTSSKYPSINNEFCTTTLNNIFEEGMDVKDALKQSQETLENEFGDK